MGNGDLTSITFVHAPDAFLAETQQYGALFMPVWAYTLAAYIDEAERYDLKLCDLRFDKIEEVAAADLFAFSGLNQDYEAIVAAAAQLRQRFPQATYIIGGPITWSLNQAGEVAQLSLFDHIFVGDGEEAFPRFLTLFAHRHTLPKVLETRQRFDVLQARGLYRPFLQQTYKRYYGAVLASVQGMPFSVRVLRYSHSP